MELPKGMGGLRVCNLRAFNSAILVKQVMRIHENESSVVSKFLHSKYKGSLIGIGLAGKGIINATWGFRGMCRVVEHCKEGFERVMGNGISTRIINHRWVSGRPISVKNGIDLEDLGLEHVKDLMVPSEKRWNSPLVWKLFTKDSANVFWQHMCQIVMLKINLCGVERAQARLHRRTPTPSL